MPSEYGVPMSAVAPDRSKMAPILTSSLVAPFDAAGLFLSLPQAAPRSRAIHRGSASFLAKRFIGSSLGGPGSRVGSDSVAERPDAEVVLRSLPQAGQAPGLDEQETNEDEAEQGELDGRQLLDEDVERAPLQGLADPGDVGRDPGHEDGPVDRPRDAAQTADDDHRHEDERPADLVVLPRHRLGGGVVGL